MSLQTCSKIFKVLPQTNQEEVLEILETLQNAFFAYHSLNHKQESSLVGDTLLINDAFYNTIPHRMLKMASMHAQWDAQDNEWSFF